MATSSAIFLARPAGVFMLLVRKASANRLILRSVVKVRRARGSASIAARRSGGIDASDADRIGAYAAAHRPSAFAASTCRCPAGCMRLAAVSRATWSRLT